VSKSQPVKVSVLMVTYNHEKYIAQAIESVLMQQVNFTYEFIIGEDCSTDRTREIVADYQKRYPHIIRALLHDTNQGVSGNVALVGGAARGQYLAALDGDDYWTSPDKLQKQVDFLDSHPDFVLCFHNCLFFQEDENGRRHNQWLHCPAEQKSVITIEDLMVANCIPTCSVMVRAGYGEFPEWIRSFTLLDWPLHILTLQNGSGGYIDEVMSAYRLHHGGSWACKPLIPRHFEVIRMFEHINVHFHFEYEKIIAQTIANEYLHIIHCCAESLDPIPARLGLIESCLIERDQYRLLAKRERPNPLSCIESNTINLIAFPDWSQPEEEIQMMIEKLLKDLAAEENTHPLLLMVDIDGEEAGEAETLLSNIVMKILFEEDLNVTENLTLIPLEGLNALHWHCLIPQLRGKITLEKENFARLEETGCQTLAKYPHNHRVFLPA
jgi:glycosyltransferase involved in cell wall biosynthesis